MTHEEVMSAIAAGAGSNDMSGGYGKARYPNRQRITEFRRRLMVTLGDLPEDMTVAELREHLDDGATDA